jgi:hypothetical protein
MSMPTDIYREIFDHWIEKPETIIGQSAVHYEFAMHGSKVEDDKPIASYQAHNISKCPRSRMN